MCHHWRVHRNIRYPIAKSDHRRGWNDSAKYCLRRCYAQTRPSLRLHSGLRLRGQTVIQSSSLRYSAGRCRKVVYMCPLPHACAIALEHRCWARSNGSANHIHQNKHPALFPSDGNPNPLLRGHTPERAPDAKTGGLLNRLQRNSLAHRDAILPPTTEPFR